eukprot:g28518.t1
MLALFQLLALLKLGQATTDETFVSQLIEAGKLQCNRTNFSYDAIEDGTSKTLQLMFQIRTSTKIRY